MTYEEWDEYKARMQALRDSYKAQRKELWQMASYDADEELMRALTGRWPPLELVAQDEHTTTVCDWRTGKHWRYAGVVPVDDLNDQLLNANKAYVDVAWMVHTEQGEWTLVE